MPVSDGQERERLRQIVWDVWIGHEMGDPATVYPGTLNKCDATAEAVVAAILPEGTVAVERERLERLRLWAEFGHRIAARGAVHYQHRALMPQTPLVPGDLDLLLPPADGEGGGT